MQSHINKSKPITKKASNAPAHDPVPLPEHGSHAYSHAAHLGAPARGQTNPAANFRGVTAGQLREPPQEIGRIGKQHR